MNNRNRYNVSTSPENATSSGSRGASPVRRYGVRGLTDYEALFHAGKSIIKVRFTGGSVTGYGVTPASFTTDNPALQAIIERSEQYTCGKIFRF